MKIKPREKAIIFRQRSTLEPESEDSVGSEESAEFAAQDKVLTFPRLGTCPCRESHQAPRGTVAKTWPARWVNLDNNLVRTNCLQN